MTTNQTIQDDPAAVLRALADGHRVRLPEWDDGVSVRLSHGCLRMNDDTSFSPLLIDFRGTWHVLPKRDMGADPRVGDVFGWEDFESERSIVNSVTTAGVMWVYGNGSICALSRELWVRKFETGKAFPVEYAND